MYITKCSRFGFILFSLPSTLQSKHMGVTEIVYKDKGYST